MKSFRRLSLGYFVALAAAALVGVSAQAEVKHNSATVRAIRGGKAQISNDKGKTWKGATVGSRLTANSVIKTDSETTADLFLGDNGPVVRVTPGTSMGIDKLDLEDMGGLDKVIETQLDLRSGRILGSVKKMAAASKYEVKTPVGVAGIRGTEYSIDARGTVSVVTGTVVVVYVVDGIVMAPQTVNAGQTAMPPIRNSDPVVIRTISQNDREAIIDVRRITEGPTGPGPVEPSEVIIPGPIVEQQPNRALADDKLPLPESILSPTQPGT